MIKLITRFLDLYERFIIVQERVLEMSLEGHRLNREYAERQEKERIIHLQQEEQQRAAAQDYMKEAKVFMKKVTDDISPYGTID